jgi:hypothetical protein
MPAAKNVGEPCAGEPHARFEVAAGGNQDQLGQHEPRSPGASRRPYIDAKPPAPNRPGEVIANWLKRQALREGGW